MEITPIIDKIGFPKEYKKLHGQKTARLMFVGSVRDDEISDEFIEYNTRAEDGHINITRHERSLFMIFLGEKLIPFTVLMPYDHEEEIRLRCKVGSVFELERWERERIPREKECKEHRKRFRIEFSVDVRNENANGKDWDWKNEDIERFALQELEFMSPFPEEIHFSEVKEE